MDRNDINSTIILLLMGIASLFSWYLYFKDYKQNDTVNISDFPTTIAEWHCVDIPLSKNDLDGIRPMNPGAICQVVGIFFEDWPAAIWRVCH